MTILIFAVITIALRATDANAGSYAVSTGMKGVVSLYDLSSVERTERGFTIEEVAVSSHFPTIFGPVAYRVDREDYDCGTGHYNIARMREYDCDGRLLNEIGRIPEDDMMVVSGTAGAEMFVRFCETGQRGVSVTGLVPNETVERDTSFDAYRYGRTLLPSAPRTP